MKIYIYHWHGTLSKKQEKKLIDMGMYVEDGKEFINSPTIGEFVDKWNDKLILFPPGTHAADKDCWLVGLTNRHSFGQS